MLRGLDRRAAALRTLRRVNCPMTFDELAAQTHVTESTLTKLEQEGLVAQQPRRTQYHLTQRYLDEVPALPAPPGSASVSICVSMVAVPPEVPGTDARCHAATPHGVARKRVD